MTVRNARLVFGGRHREWNALSYDRELKLLVLNHSSARRVWTRKFDRRTANLEGIKHE